MFHFLPARWLAALSAIAAGGALAQPAPTPQAPAPADAPALPYRSAFEGYRPYAQDKPVAWKEANETVRQRGGWRAYAREVATDTDTGEAAVGLDTGTSSSGVEAADPHAGHAGHGRPAAAEAPNKERP